MIRYNGISDSTDSVKPFRRSDMFQGLSANLEVKMSGKSTNIYPFGTGENMPYITLHRSVYDRQPAWRFIGFNVYNPDNQGYQSMILPSKVVVENAGNLKMIVNIVKLLKQFVSGKNLNLTTDIKKIHQYLASIIQRDFKGNF